MTQGTHCYPSVRVNSRRPGLAQLFGIIVMLTFIAIVCGFTARSASGVSPVAKEAEAMIARCTADLAQRLKLKAQDIKVIETRAKIWPDAALGMPEHDKMYAQVLTSGWKIILEARGSRYLYATSATAYRYGGPLSCWSCSMLYLMPVADEANLNGDLYQCSLLGTNSVLITSGVTDYYPQNNGVLIVKRRLSRSSQELRYVKVNEAGQSRMLHTAFDFGDAAMNSAQDRWAAFVRPSMGSAWNVVVAHLAQDDTPLQMLPLPQGAQPGRIGWSGDKLMILAEIGEGTACFEITPHTDEAVWKRVTNDAFPGMKTFMLNNHEMPEITQVNKDAKPNVEAARVRSATNRNVIATISGLTLRGYDLLGARYAVVWGEKDAEPAAYTVDIVTGELIAGFHGDSRDIKPFDFSPISTP